MAGRSEYTTVRPSGARSTPAGCDPNALGSATSPVKVTLRVDDPAARDRTGSFVRARVTTDVHQDVVAVPRKALVSAMEYARLIVVPEMNMGQMIHEVRRCIEGRARVVGVNRADGEPIIPEQILDRIMEVV